MNKTSLAMLAAVAAVFFGIWEVWQWGFCRFYVGPGEIAVVTAKNGTPLPPGQILAKSGQKGVQEDVLAEGRHFLNPVAYEYQIVPATLVPPGKVGIITSKGGTNLPPGEFLASAGQKGIWRQALGPGKYRLNPVGYEVRIVDAISIPIGYVGVVTSLSGKQAPEGEFARTGEKGIRADILQPGLYYVNPAAFKVDVVEVGVNQVMLLGKSGGNVITKGQITTTNAAMDELQRNALVQQQEQRREYAKENKLNLGVNSLISPDSSFSATGSIKPDTKKKPRPQKEMSSAKPVPQQSNAPAAGSSPVQAAFVLNQFVEFPSKDGFEISLDMTVEFELLPENIAWIFRNYGDLPAAVDKVIMPQILSISRLKGSAYGARDFIVGEGREKFQTDLTDALAKVLGEKKIVIHNALIRHVNVPMQILDPIQQASIAQEQDLTNQEKQNTAKKQAELNTQLSLIDQAGQQVGQETEKLKANIKADQTKKVAEIGGETLRQAAEIQKQTAAIRAEKTTTLGKAQAQVIRLVEGEKAQGYQMKIKAFGDPVAYNLWTLATSLDNKIKVNILHSGPGTLWTDLQKANLGELGGAKLLQPAKKP
ncbi:MAG: SPFH domain-containing protein [Chthoniobacteraceae bacterium]|nr:SPFH domain-containing protein [Chthoniobacteraceae bacterium]